MQTVLTDKKYTASGIEVVGQSFGYDYDDIGNLKTENRNGNVFKYTSNDVNQYTQRTVPSRINISGSADASAKVTIKQASAGYTKPLRYGNYFNSFFTLDNSTNAVTDSFDIYAVKFDGTKDKVAKQTLNVFVPKTPEFFTYDNDGNLLTDGRFTYTWNGENRLIKAETPDTRLEFVYDYMGRRINKKVYTNNVLSSERKFTYDGWNLAAEYDANNTLLNSYLWGEDLSGSLQGAGGVGGLLAVNNYLPCYDGNGNITSYLDNSGNTVATYEYNPFGKIICAFGTKADDFAYRFSTKYFDKETALYYYGYRYYSANVNRWLSRDPIEEQGGNNLYVFVGNSPLNYIDVLGNAAKSTTYTPGPTPSRTVWKRYVKKCEIFIAFGHHYASSDMDDLSKIQWYLEDPETSFVWQVGCTSIKLKNNPNPLPGGPTTTTTYTVAQGNALVNMAREAALELIFNKLFPECLCKSVKIRYETFFGVDYNTLFYYRSNETFKKTDKRPKAYTPPKGFVYEGFKLRLCL
ncbi:MAG: hypothetical protein A2020_00335 [Lentisphaerae bacterium GWF2_45_14]|nr:MAG: hypothetical protein A2020_00335 [Lentisphaerae bacterium GWF2_45_14]